jgi:hypothetical protein
VLAGRGAAEKIWRFGDLEISAPNERRSQQTE